MTTLLMMRFQTNRQKGSKEPSKGIAGDNRVHVGVVHHLQYGEDGGVNM